MDKKNVELVHEEETQFQEYASRVSRLLIE